MHSRSDYTRRTFLKEVGASAAAIVGAGEVRGVQAGAFARPGEDTREKESPGKPPTAETAAVRQEIDLSGRWRFQVDLWDEGQKLEYFSPDFPTQDWQEVSIPRAFDDCAPGMYKFRGICWFCRQFDAPLSMRDRHVHDFPSPRATMGKVLVYFALTLLQPLA